MSSAIATVRNIYCYPVKGLTAQALRASELKVRETLPNDRLYAIENGASGFEAARPAHLPKQQFVMLMKNARLAQLKTRFAPLTHRLAIELDGAVVAAGELGTAQGRAAIAAFFAEFCADELRGPPKVLSAAGHSFSDVAKKVVSIINVASLTELEGHAGLALDPRRFRPNLVIEGWPAWHELALLGHEIAIGPTARLKLIKPIARCAAIDVDPQRGIRNLTLNRTLLQNFGHNLCGVYAEVVAAGAIELGARVTLSN